VPNSSTLIEAICRRAGLHFHAGLLQPMDIWIEQRIKKLGLNSTADYFAWLGDQAHLQSERPGLSTVASSRETFFMRDHGQMDVLRDAVLPELFAARAQQKTLRLWSMGCSTGEEPYSLAILLRESGLLQPYWKIEVVGFDINLEALHTAQQGFYREWSFRGCTDEFKHRYFHFQKDGWQINDSLRQSVSFKPLDLLSPLGENPLQADLIFCRNVFIYLDRATIPQALSYLTHHLVEGGYLFCAPGELASFPRPDLAICAYPQAVIYRKTSQGMVHEASTSATGPRVVETTITAIPTTLQEPSFPEKQNLVASKTQPQAEWSETLNRAWQLANRGQLDLANGLCEQVRASHPLDPDVYYLNAILALAMGKTDTARDELRRVLYLQPDFLLAYPLLTELFVAAQDQAAAQRYCRQGLVRVVGLAPDQPVSLYTTGTVVEITAHLEQLMATLGPSKPEE
jgi:chemotaxis protein methyltransferase CheR